MDTVFCSVERLVDSLWLCGKVGGHSLWLCGKGGGHSR